MDNIEIKRTPTNKRNMQSLLEQSAIDNTFNYEAQQIRQAYNKTIRDLNQAIKQHQRSIAKLELEIKQKDQIIKEQHVMIVEKEGKWEKTVSQNLEHHKTIAVMKKRLHHVQYKLQTIQKNRKQVARQLENYTSPDTEQQDDKAYLSRMSTFPKQQYKKQIYRQVTQILNTKIAKFVKQLKRFPMSIELEQNIQAFLQEILYINSNQSRHKLFHQQNETTNTYDQNSIKRKIGKIHQRRGGPGGSDKLSDLQQWKLMQKSLQKLKSTSSPYSKQTTRQRQRQQTKRYERPRIAKNRYDYSPHIKPTIQYT